MNSLAFVLLVLLSDTAGLGELSLVWDSLSFQSAELEAKGSGTIELLGIGVAFAMVPIAEIVFATLADRCTEACALLAFAELTVVCGAVVVAELRGVLPGVVACFVLLDAATNIPAVTQCATSVAVFHCGPFAWGFENVLLLTDPFVALLASTRLWAQYESSSS